jgi:hypothetical protein
MSVGCGRAGCCPSLLYSSTRLRGDRRPLLQCCDDAPLPSGDQSKTNAARGMAGAIPPHTITSRRVRGPFLAINAVICDRVVRLSALVTALRPRTARRRPVRASCGRVGNSVSRPVPCRRVTQTTSQRSRCRRARLRVDESHPHRHKEDPHGEFSTASTARRLRERSD